MADVRFRLRWRRPYWIRRGYVLIPCPPDPLSDPNRRVSRYYRVPCYIDQTTGQVLHRRPDPMLLLFGLTEEDELWFDDPDDDYMEDQ